MEAASLPSAWEERWLPKSVLCLREYNFNKFGHDLVAGVTVGLVALPLEMAFSIASGLSPQAGIYCAVVTGLGTAVKFIPRPIVIGLTNGIAVLIASTQIKDFLDCSWQKCRASSGCG